MACDRDLYFISGDFESYQIPKDKRYLLKYFKTKVQTAFVKYYMIFGNYENFIDHTGYWCRDKYLKALHERLNSIQEIHKDAKSSMDLNLLTKIESGKFKFTKIPDFF